MPGYFWKTSPAKEPLPYRDTADLIPFLQYIDKNLE